MRTVLAALLASVSLGAQVPPMPLVGHTFTIDVQAPAPDVAESYTYTIYLDALSTGITLTGVTCKPIVPFTTTAVGNVFACTGELPKLQPGSFHSLRYTIGTHAATGPMSAPVPFVYQPASALPPSVSNPRVQ